MAEKPRLRKIRTTINGESVEAEIDARLLLCDFLRHQLHLTGTHVGCEHGVCGACTILLNGRSVRSCLAFAVQIDGADVTTVEGLAKGEALHPLQSAFTEFHALQCGFCTPGMLTTLVEFLRANADPTAAQIREAISGNLCRCTGYDGIVKAALSAAQNLRSRGERP